MKAKDLMTTDVFTVSPENTIAEAAKLMIDRRISGLPVVDHAGRLVGILSEGDLMRRAELGNGQWARPATRGSPELQAQAFVKANSLKVSDVMTNDVVTISEDTPQQEIALLFEERGVKRAPVTRHGNLVGIVSRANLLQSLAGGTMTPGPSDRQIKSDILRVSSEQAGVRTQLVDVTVADGVVHLWGNVATVPEHEAIRVVAENTEGVHGVKNHLRVLPSMAIDYKPE